MCKNCKTLLNFFEKYHNGLNGIEKDIESIMDYFIDMDTTYRIVLNKLKKNGPPPGSTVNNMLWRDSCWYPIWNDFKKKRNVERKTINEHLAFT